MSVPATEEERGSLLEGTADDRVAPASADVTVIDLPAPRPVEAAEQPLMSKPSPFHFQKLKVSLFPPFRVHCM